MHSDTQSQKSEVRTTKILHNFILKWEKGLNRYFSKDDVQMANVLMKIHGISLVTKNANENHSNITSHSLKIKQNKTKNRKKKP